MAKGDHLYVSRGYGTYTHHGIDCGDGTVIHYKEGEAIARSSMAFFARGEQVFVKPYGPDLPTDAADLVLQRAVSRIGERDYNVIFNNCEHFATWCKTGKHESEQVQGAMAASAIAGTLGGVALGGVFALPVIAAAGVYGVSQLLEQAQQAQLAHNPQQAQASLSRAIALVSTQRQELETALDKALREAYAWDCAARLALQQGREDLSRAALAKKYPFKKEALKLRDQLDEVMALEARIRGMG